MNKNKLLFNIFEKISIIFAVAILSLTAFNSKTTEAKVLDEIISYEITADVNDDATVTLTYDIDWKVLDSTSEGPLEWVQIGIPNSNCTELTALSDNIKSISLKKSGGAYAVIYFNQIYIKDEIAEFSFSIKQDNMYQVFPEENVAEYTFTPGWFDSIAVDKLKIKWNTANTLKIEPASLYEGDYYCWEASLSPGEKFSVEIQYPLDAYAFDLTQHNTNNNDDGYSFSEHSLIENILFSILMIIVIIFIVIICSLPVIIPAIIVYVIYKAATGFRVTKEKKITRTIVEYYESCPNCGGTREEGKEKCSYCGTNMVKSKQVITEENKVSEDDKKALTYSTNGEYRYSSNPNRYVRVNVVTIPHVIQSAPVRSSSSFSSSGHSHHSSCAHSSCACACACACAGGGRAGCTTKDFYNTNMKLKYLEKICK